MFTKGNEPVPWRGPILHQALEQFLADVYWGDLDVLLLDLPPGTGDVAISVGHLLPGAELLVVATPAGCLRRGGRTSRSPRTPAAPAGGGRYRDMPYLPVPALR